MNPLWVIAVLLFILIIIEFGFSGNTHLMAYIESRRVD